MFHLPDRRVRTLRLTATGDQHLWPGRILLQGALQNASFPGLSSNRLTLIKRFTIGRFSPGQSSASLSALIDQKVADLSSRAVPADHPNAAAAPAVYFRDEIEPYVMLAVRIAGNADTSAWFWPLAVSVWRPAMSRSEGLRALLFQLAGTRAGPASVVTLISELRRRDLLEPLLAGLEKDEAADLLQLTCGAALPDGRTSQELHQSAVTEISSVARRALWQACKRWDGLDVRAIWLATMLLVEKKPARLLDPLLIHHARALVGLISQTLSPTAKSSAAEKPSLIIANEHADSSQQPAGPTEVDLSLRVPGTETRDQNSPVDFPFSSLALTADPTPAQTEVTRVEKMTRRSRPNTTRKRRVPLSRNSGESRSVTPGSQTIVRDLENDRLRHDDRRLSDDASVKDLPLSEPAAESCIRRTLQVPLIEGGARPVDQVRVRAGDPGETPVSQRAQQDLPWPPEGDRHVGRGNRVARPSLVAAHEGAPIDHPQDQVQLSRPTALQRTDFGGFYFLLALLGRLHLTEFLENHPQLIELDFPRRLLLFAADQMSIPAADPVRALLQDVNDLPEQEIEFSAPAIWREQLYRSGALVWSPVAGRPGYRMMTDRSGRNVLAIWRGEMPEGGQKLIGDSQTRVGNARQCKDDLQVLLAGWYRAMRRWCRGYAGISLLDLIRRTGRIALTRTHVDLFFDLRSADIRIRRVGLDVDPGWLPWLGRVVSFHYLDKEEIDGRE